MTSEDYLAAGFALALYNSSDDRFTFAYGEERIEVSGLEALRTRLKLYSVDGMRVARVKDVRRAAGG